MCAKCAILTTHEANDRDHRSRQCRVHPRAARRHLLVSRAGARCASSCTTSTPSGSRRPRRSRTRPHARPRRHPEVVDGPRSTPCTRRRRLRHQRDPGGDARRHRARLRHPGPLRPAPDHRRHHRRRRNLPRAADLSGARRHRRGHGGGLPGRVAAELHQPHGHERHLPAPRRTEAEGAGSVPLGALDDGRVVRAHRRSVRRVSTTGRPASITRPGCCDGNAQGENLYPLLDERIAANPELRRRVRVDMYRRLGLLPDRNQRALQRVRPVVSAPPIRGRPATAQRRRVRRHQRGQPGRVRSRSAPSSLTRTPSKSTQDQPSTPRR